MSYNFRFLYLVPLLFLFGVSLSQAQETGLDPESQLKKMGIELKLPDPPVANFVLAVRVGNMVYLSGHGPTDPNGDWIRGKVGSEMTIEKANEAARLTGIALLASLKAEIGSLNKVKRIVKVLGMVNSDPTFDKHPQVMNGFSDFMVEVFGESGKHARSAVGMGSLPHNIPVEIEMIVELKE